MGLAFLIGLALCGAPAVAGGADAARLPVSDRVAGAPPVGPGAGATTDRNTAIEGARAPIETLHAALLDSMKQGDALALEDRKAFLAPVIETTYDLDFMAATVLGRHWRKLGDQDRDRWRKTFGRLTTVTYAERFDRYGGERFELISVEPSRRGTVMVRTRIVPTDEDPVPITYRMRFHDGRWRAIDVYLNGTVSELALRRSEYSSVLQHRGFEALLSSLKGKLSIEDAAAEH